MTIKDRLPVILVKVLDTVCRDKHIIGESHGEVLKSFVDFNPENSE